MLDCIASGKLVRDPAVKTGQGGKPFCNFLLAVHVGEPEPVVIACIAFSETAQRVMKLAKGDALSITGPLKPTTWVDKSNGEERHGLSIVASAVLSVYDVAKRRGKLDEPQ